MDRMSLNVPFSLLYSSHITQRNWYYKKLFVTNKENNNNTSTTTTEIKIRDNLDHGNI